jgi:hypothetical protein
MRSLVLGAAITMATAVGVKAADLAYPPQYGAVVPPAVVAPQVIVVPGPAAVPQYNGAPVPPAVVGPSYGVPPPVAAGVAVVPRRPCAPVSRCGVCDWQAGCAPYPERYLAPSESLGPQGYPGPQTPPVAEPYSGQYAPRVYSGPTGPYGADRGSYRPSESLGPQGYPGPQTPSAAEPYSGQYAPRRGPYRPYESLGPQGYPTSGGGGVTIF